MLQRDKQIPHAFAVVAAVAVVVDVVVPVVVSKHHCQ